MFSSKSKELHNLSKTQVVDMQNAIFLKDTVEVELMMELFSSEWLSTESFCNCLVHLSHINNQSDLQLLQVLLNCRSVILSNIIADIGNELDSPDYSINSVLDLFKNAINWLQQTLICVYRMYCVIDANGHSMYTRLKCNSLRQIMEMELAFIDPLSETNPSDEVGLSNRVTIIQPSGLQAYHTKCRDVIHGWLSRGFLGELKGLCQKWLSKANLSNNSLAITNCKNDINACCLGLFDPSFNEEWYHCSKYVFGNAPNLVDNGGSSACSAYLWTNIFHSSFMTYMSELVRASVLNIIKCFVGEYMHKFVLEQCCQLHMCLNEGTVEFEKMGQAQSAKCSDGCHTFNPVKVFKIASHCSEYLMGECLSLLMSYKYYLETTQDSSAEASIEVSSIMACYILYLIMHYSGIMWTLHSETISCSCLA